MSYKFHAKTQEGYIFKILIELLQQILISATFQLDENGMRLCMVDSNRKIMVSIMLDANRFNKFDIDEPFDISISLNQLYKMLKSIKKKDSLELFITDAQPSKLQFYIVPPDNNRKAHSCIQIQNTQLTLIDDIPSGYEHPILVSTSDYQSTLKDMNNISNVLQIVISQNAVRLSAYSENVVSRSVILGDTTDVGEVYVQEQFEMEHFNRVLKLAGLSKVLEIQGKAGLPLHLRADVGRLGSISIYLKPVSSALIL